MCYLVGQITAKIQIVLAFGVRTKSNVNDTIATGVNRIIGAQPARNTLLLIATGLVLR